MSYEEEYFTNRNKQILKAKFMDLKSVTIEQHIQMYWGMDDANRMESEATLKTEKEYCEHWGFDWREWYELRKNIYK